MQSESVASNEIEQAIKHVRWIFNNDPSPPRPSASEFFTGRTRGKSGQVSLKPTSSRPGLRHHASETARTQFSRPAIDLRYEGGRHFAVVNSLPEHQIALLRAIYQPASPDQFQCAIHLARHLHDEYISTIPRQMRIATRQLIRRMVDAKIAAARDWRLAIALRSRPHELFDVEYDSWKKNKAQHWRGIGACFDAMHDHAVLAVYKQL